MFSDIRRPSSAPASNIGPSSLGAASDGEYTCSTITSRAGNWSRATEYARKVLQAAPEHHGAQALVQEARNQAKDVYLRGYQLMETNPDEAIRLFKEVMNMTPSDDEYNQKAKARMAELQGK